MTNHTNLPELGHAEVLMNHWHGLFVSVLRNADVSDASWKARLNTLDVFGLTEFREPSKHKAKPIEFDHARLEEPAYRRMLIRKLKAPRPGKWTALPAQNRARKDPRGSLRDSDRHSAFLKFTNIVLSEVESNSATMLLLTKLDVDSLTRCLDKFQKHYPQRRKRRSRDRSLRR